MRAGVWELIGSREFCRKVLWPNDVARVMGHTLGVISFLSLFYSISKEGWSPAVEEVIVQYDRLIGVLAGWLHPFVDSTLSYAAHLTGFDLELLPHWKHICAICGIYFFRNAAVSFSFGLFGTGALRSVLGVSLSVLVGALCGALDPGSSSLFVQSFFVAVPMLAYALYRICILFWAGLVLRRSWASSYTYRSSSFLVFVWDGIVDECKRISLAALLGGGYFLGASMIFVPYSGFSTLVFLLVVMAIAFLLEGAAAARVSGSFDTVQDVFWDQGSTKLGAAMIGVAVWVGSFLAGNQAMRSLGL